MAGRAERRPVGGSRFLYDSFDLAQVQAQVQAQARIEAQERLDEERRAGLEYRLGRIEAAVERLEKRLWLTVYGVAAGVLAHGALTLMARGL